jgi:hypothetical protein
MDCKQCDNKSSGEDGIQFSMLKASPDEAKEYLVYIFNDIFNSGIITESWQKTKVYTNIKTRERFKQSRIIPSYQSFIVNKLTRLNI